jgi:lipopolysaccharide/colanic/teichoic acid biosynthesis glycosyltransferase
LSEPNRILPERMFVSALVGERKRSERSRKMFVLMLLNSGMPERPGPRDKIANRTASAMVSTVRETDIVGWYKAGRTLGVIFVEVGGADKCSILNALHKRVRAALRPALTLDELNETRVSFHCFPEDPEDYRSGPAATAILYPDVAEHHGDRKAVLRLKRTVDIVGSAVALAMLSPILLAVAAAVKLSSQGPILFTQERIGQYGMPFTCLKFRSMYCGNDSQIHVQYVKRFIGGSMESGAPEVPHKGVYKITQDRRVTRVGSFLRKASLDELPQLVNVLRGEMSLVGPRPAIAYELEAYDIWHRRRLVGVKPGITGLWQVTGRSRLRFDDMVRLDLKYVTTWSLWLDLKILLKTLVAVCRGDGAY